MSEEKVDPQISEEAIDEASRAIYDVREMIASLTRQLSPSRAVSVWSANGTPESQDGLYGAERSLLFLLPVTAETGQVQQEFVSSCSRTDGVAYLKGRIREVRYHGWAWLPETQPRWKADRNSASPARDKTSDKTPDKTLNNSASESFRVDCPAQSPAMPAGDKTTDKTPDNSRVPQGQPDGGPPQAI